MTTSIPTSSIQGSIFELVARGKKDTYFAVDRTTSTLPFNSSYESSAPYIQERRTTVPLNNPQFGNTFEIEIDKFGDVLTEATLLVDLPTWLPPLPVAANLTGPTNKTNPPQIANGLYWIKDLSDNSYGYSDYVGLYLFEKIQFYQDQFLIQEWSGDSLFMTGATEGSWNSMYLADQYLAGVDVGSPGRAIAYRATPGRLRLDLPLPGLQTPGDGGFPLCCLPSQAYRFRIKLRPLEQLVVTDSTAIPPFGSTTLYPWNVPQFHYTIPATIDTSSQEILVTPLERNLIGNPTILLETRQAYLPHEIRQGLQTNKQSIPFRRTFENVFTFGELDYKPLDISGGLATVTRRLDARHPVERLQFAFRTANALDTNRYTDFTDPLAEDTQFYQFAKLVIAGKDREYEFAPFVWQDLTNYAKDEIDTGYNLSEMRWSLGDQMDRVRPFSRVPEGTINFTTADRPTLLLQLNDVPRQRISGLRKTELRVVMEGWDVYEINEGRGRLLFAN
jgi:hypothetical protein